MGMLERLSDARGTLEGKIVAVILAILLVLPVATVTAFANGDADEEATTETEQTQTAEPEAVEEVADQGSTPVAESEPTQPVVSPEPAQPSGESVQQQPEGDSSAQQPVEDEEGQDVVLALDIDEGATVSVKNESGVYEPYTKLDTELAAKNGEDIEFTVKADEGYAIGGICYIDESGIKSELEPDAYDVFVIEGDDVADGAIIKVACGEAALLSEEEPEAANVVEDEWVYPAAPQNILGKSWCTTTSLEQSTFEASAATSLGSEEGAAPKDFASSSINKGGKTYLFHHARLQPVSDQQLSQKAIDDYFRPLNLSEDEKKAQTNAMLNRWYDSSAAITALRFNQSANTWEYRQATDWTAFSPNEMQLVLYYNQELHIGDNVIMNAKDWPYTEAEWVQGQGASTPSCVIYQIYSADNQKIGDQYRTYYYSPTADKPGMALSIAQYWEIQEVCVKAQPSAPSVEKKKAYKKVSSPNTYTELANQSGVGYTTKDTDNFDIPFVRLGGGKYPVWLVGLKVNALPSEQTLTVEYLDSVTEQPVKDAISVAAKKPNGTALPTWGDYNVRVEGGKLAGNLESAEITTNIGSEPTVVNFTIDSENYASTSVRAVLDGNTLKLYFPRLYDVSYKWTGLEMAGVKKFVDADGRKTLEKPDGAKGIVTGDTYSIDSHHNAGDYAYALDANDNVMALYRFSGWKIDGAGDVVEGDITVNSNIRLEGVWHRLTDNYSGTVHIEGQYYNNDTAYTSTLTSEFKDGSGLTQDESPTYMYSVKDGEELDGAPKDAGAYTVTAIWDANEDHPSVTASCDFAISPKAVTLLSASDEKTFDGSALKAESMEKMEGFVSGQGVDVTYTGERTNPGVSPNTYTFKAKEGTNLDNYAIPAGAGTIGKDGNGICTGTLTVKDRDGNNRIPVELVAASSRINTYDGTEKSVSGLALITVTNPADNTIINGNPTTASFQYGNNTYTVSNFTAGVSAIDAGEHVATIATPENEKFVVKDAQDNDVTNQFDVSAHTGILEIAKRPVTLTSQTKSKVYDGTRLQATEILNLDPVLADEATVVATGTVTHVSEGAVQNLIADPAQKANIKDGVNKFNPNNYVITKNPGTLSIKPQNIDPDTDNGNGPEDPDNPYKGIRVSRLDSEQYEGKAWVDRKKPVATTSADKPLALGTDYTVSATTTDTTNVGLKVVTVTGKGDYTGTVTRSYEVTPAPVQIIVDDKGKKYGESDPAFTGTITGLFENDRNNNELDNLGVVEYKRFPVTKDAVTLEEEVGKYEQALDAIVTNQNGNYQAPVVTKGNFVINAADAPTINAQSLTVTYDGLMHSVNASVTPSEGWMLEYAESENGPWSTQLPEKDNVGTYTIWVKTADRANYNGAGPVSATLVINPAPVTITVNDATKVAGTDDPEFTGTIEGEVAGHELTGVSYFRKGDSEAVGTYIDELTADYDENGNYAVTVIDGDFTITPVAVPAVPPTPPTPGPLDTLITTVTDFLATPVIGPGAAAVEAIADDGNPLAQIEDDGTPMSAFDHPFCWVHYYILLGIIITAIYGGGVIARRLGYNHKVKKYEDDVLGEDKSKGTEKSPVAKEGVQPTI